MQNKEKFYLIEITKWQTREERQFLEKLLAEKEQEDAPEGAQN